tara:strand:- start:901 stop:1428 length:528 start_codon:yes stop_codon:yes gene_type:complete
MKNIKLKYSLILLSYLILVFLIILSYVSIIPDTEITILESSEPLIEKTNNVLNDDKNTVYEILEKENNKPKTLEDIIENEINTRIVDTPVNKKKFKIQVASFKEKKKSLEISEILKNKFSNNLKLNFDIKKITLKNDEIFYRIISQNNYSLIEAKELCRKIIKNKNQCLIVMDQK